MWTTIRDVTDSLWPLLPQLTTGLRFCTALIGMGCAVDTAIRRYHRRPRARS